LRELIGDTEGQWSDGIGEGCFDSVMDRRNVFIDLAPDTGGKVKATQVDDGTPPPQKSPAKVSAEALWKACADGDLVKVKQLVGPKVKLDTRGRYGRTPLIAAIANDHLDVALYLIANGAGRSATDKEKNTPLWWAAIRSGWVKTHQNVKLAEALLEAGALVDAPDKDGVTALLWAANRGAVKLVELLLARGADVNAKATGEGYAGRTALMFAQGIAVVRLLLGAGADAKALDAGEQPTWEHHTGAARKLLKEKAGA
jgi:ankyrin repeat protein